MNKIMWLKKTKMIFLFCIILMKKSIKNLNIHSLINNNSLFSNKNTKLFKNNVKANKK